METLKTCRECGKDKSLAEFYKHPKMLDGHLNKCKACVKARVKTHRSENISKIREYDRSRGSDPHRVTARKAYSLTDKGRESSNKAKVAFIARNPKKRKAHIIVSTALKLGKLSKGVCEVCGSAKNAQAHHDDYDKPLDIRWLCPKHHAEWHKHNKPINGD
jgi:hypothetical protein